MAPVLGVVNDVVNLGSDVGVDLAQDVVQDGVGLESRKRKRKKRRKVQNQSGDDTDLVQNINQVNQEVDHSRYPESSRAIKVRTLSVITETDSDVRLKAEHLRLHGYLERTPVGNEISLESRKRKRKKKRKKQNQSGDDTNLVQNINQVNQEVDHSRYPESSSTTKVQTQPVISEIDADVRLKAEHRRLRGYLERTPVGNEIIGGKVIKRANPVNESLGKDRTNILSNLSLVDVSDVLEQDTARNGVSLESRKKRKRKGKEQNTMGDDTNLVQNVNHVNQDVEHSMYPNPCTTTMVQCQPIIKEADSNVKLKAENQSLLEPLERTASGNETSRGIVTKKVDPLNGFLGIDHTTILSNLSLIPVTDGLKDAKLKKKKKKKSRSQASGSVVREESSICMSKNISQVNQDAEHSVYSSTCTTTPSQTPSIITEEISRGMVLKKDDPIDGLLGIDHTRVLSNLSLINVSEALKGAKLKKKKKKKKKGRQQSSGSAVEEESIICTSKIMPSGVPDGANLCSVPRPLANLSRKGKLLVLDINGLLANIVMPPPKGYKADKKINGRAIFKRPFYYEFLVFCFERFDVGIWSSRSKKIINNLVDYLLGDMKHKLLFCWNMLHCTQTSFKTLENKHKPLVFKELKKLWEKDDPLLPWERGDYSESNTVLLDDSPYKALLNPIHTAIFPKSFHYGAKCDRSLGPGGDLRVYLEDLARCDNVQNYIMKHPFGQGALDERNSQWEFYSKVLSSFSTEDTKKG